MVVPSAGYKSERRARALRTDATYIVVAVGEDPPTQIRFAKRDFDRRLHNKLNNPNGV